jgi:hypothetical protein
VFATTIDGGSGRNELDASGATGGALMTITLNADGRSGTVQGMNSANATTGSVSSPATSATTFTNIDILDTSGLLNNVVNWGNAQGVTINGNSTKQDYFFVNGGGNHIDGRYTGSGESIYSQSGIFAQISYANMKIGLTANFDSGTVSFADGRASDSIVNFSRFQGSAGNDVITGHANQSDWITASGGNDSINAGGGTSNVYAVFDNTYRVYADFQTGTVLKYNSAGTIIGTDTVSNFQQFVGGNASGEVVHGKDGVNMTFWMGDAGTKTLLASYASNSISGGSSITTIDYTGMTSPITVDLSGHTVAKGGNGGTDSFSAVANIIGTKGDDIFVFNAQTDVTSLGLNGNGGNDVLEKTSSTAGTFDLSTLLSKVTNIERIDFSTSSAADKITVDFTNLLSRGNETLTLSTSAKDTVTMTHNTAGDGWTQSTTTSGGHTTDTFTLGGHQLIWTH